MANVSIAIEVNNPLTLPDIEDMLVPYNLLTQENIHAADSPELRNGLREGEFVLEFGASMMESFKLFLKVREGELVVTRFWAGSSKHGKSKRDGEIIIQHLKEQYGWTDVRVRHISDPYRID